MLGKFGKDELVKYLTAKLKASEIENGKLNSEIAELKSRIESNTKLRKEIAFLRNQISKQKIIKEEVNNEG